MRTKFGVILVIIMVMASGLNAFAGTTYVDFGFNLPGFNASKYTAAQTKVTMGATGEISNYSTGASANVDARMVNQDDSAGNWTRNLNKNATYYKLEGSTTHKANDIIRAQFSSDITTTVGVDIAGKFRSN
jgi:hypothetical protein